MSECNLKPNVTIYIDGQSVLVPAGINLVEAVKRVKKEIPHYCYHPRLTVAGNCRMCLLEIGTTMKDRSTGQPLLDEQGQPKISWSPKPAIGCGTPATEGLHIRTNSPMVQDCQKGVMEFLLVNHPLDCPICDQAGECSLQEYATDYGRGESRFVENKNVKPKQTQLGPRVMLDDERCILCSRCIRFCKEIMGENVLGFVDRGSYSTLTCYPGKQLDSNYSLNTVDICPVGALTSMDFRFKMRVWFLKKTPSICTESSVGVNTDVWSREGKVYRITPRDNDAVNDSWMADSGRARYQAIEAEERLTAPKINGNKVTLPEALERACELFDAAQKVAYVASGYMSVEEQWIWRQLIEAQKGPSYGVCHAQAGDGFLISADATPNIRGGLVTGLWTDVPGQDLRFLGEKIDNGSISMLVVHSEDLFELGLTEAQLRKVEIIYMGTHRNRLSDFADVVLPSLMVFEKKGTFINQQFRLQKFEQAVPGPVGLLPDICLLERLRADLMGDAYIPPTLDQIWSEMAQAIPALQGLSYRAIPSDGVVLSQAQSSFGHLRFLEGSTLHYQPASS